MTSTAEHAKTHEFKAEIRQLLDILTHSVYTSKDVFLRELWAGILVQFMVCDAATGEPVGFVVAHSADLKSGFAHVAVLMSPAAMGRGWGVEAGALFITYLFATWSFRKLYAEGWPLKVIYHGETGGGPAGTTVTKVEQRNISEAEFTPPTGYKSAPLSEVFGTQRR